MSFIAVSPNEALQDQVKALGELFEQMERGKEVRKSNRNRGLLIQIQETDKVQKRKGKLKEEHELD